MPGNNERSILTHSLHALPRLRIAAIDTTTATAPTTYVVDWRNADGDDERLEIRFQTGTVSEEGENGVTIEALLAIAADRLQRFQERTIPCRENAVAITHIETALHWLNARTLDRLKRDVEGTYRS